MEEARGPTLQAHFFTGDRNMDVTVRPPEGLPYRLVYARCHFSGGTGVAEIKASAVSHQGSEWNHELYKDVSAGCSASGVSDDCNMRFEQQETAWPSPWSFCGRDSLKFSWTNPNAGTMTWGLEVGVAIEP